MLSKINKIPLGIYITFLALVLGIYADCRMLYLQETADRALFVAFGYPNMLNILVLTFIILECYALYMILLRRKFGMYLTYAIYCANVFVTLCIAVLLSLGSGNYLAKIFDKPSLIGIGQSVSFSDLAVHMIWYIFMYIGLGFALYSARRFFTQSPHHN